MVVLQLINRIVQTSDMSLILDNNLTREMFSQYENEFDFIQNHFQNYGKVPDKETFLDTFREFSWIEVTETNKFLIDKLREEYLYLKAVPVIQQSAELLKSDSNEAVEYLLQEISKLNDLKQTEGVDIVENAAERFNEYSQKLEGEDKQYITTGFQELDTIFKGFSRGEELVVLFARIGQGKSWILNKMLSHSWEIGLNVGLISPEMSATKIGYRFDTLVNHFNNKNLVWRTRGKRL